MEIYTLPLDEPQPALRLTYSSGIDEDPAWSPDGQYLIFTSLRDGNHELYRMRSDGTQPPQRLTIDCGRDQFPVWSPGTLDTPLSLPQLTSRLVSIQGERRVNLRAGPATSYDALSDAAPDECLTAIGRSRDNGWLQVRTYQGKTLWVALHLTDFPQTDLAALPVTEGRG
jgi:hypothetical protein